MGLVDLKNMSMAANKFASILSTAFLIGLSLIVLCLVFRVRTLYQDHQKLNRFEVYKNELQSIQNHYTNLKDDIDQVDKDFRQTYRVVGH